MSGNLTPSARPGARRRECHGRVRGIAATFGAGNTEEDKAEGAIDPVGLPLALDAAQQNPRLEPAVRDYLYRQRALVDLQIKHLDEEHRLAIAAARRKAFLDRMRMCVQGLVSLLIAGLVGAVILMLSSAMNERGVVIDAVSVPEDLARKGFTGEVVAKHILDRLAEINKASGTVRAANAYSDGLGGGIKLEIPETGISIGELSAIADLENAKTTIKDVHDSVAVLGFQTAAYPLLAEAYARVGRDADANAMVALIPPDAVGGWLARGRVATLRHAYAAAEQAFNEAARQAPSLPQAYFDWGAMLVAKGDLEGAIMKFTKANRRSPLWADPLEAWGDVLARQGQIKRCA